MTKARDLANASTALSAVDATELAFVDGVTSAIQTQMDTKTAKSTLTTTGDIYYASAANTPARLGIGSSAQVLTVASGIPSWATPAGGGGKVLQVVSANYTTATAVAVATYTATGLSLSITPTSATSKILVMINQQAYFGRDNADQGHGLKIFRGATQIFDTVGAGSAAYNYVLAAGGVEAKTIVPMTCLDSPATTSSTTYTTQGRPLYTTNSGQVVYQHASATSTITLMEIGA